MLQIINQIRKNITQRGLAITIHDLKKLCFDHHLTNMMYKIESIENDYTLMTQFFESGFEDSHRNELYQKLQRQLYSVILAIKVECMADFNPTFKQCRVNVQSTLCEYEKIEETLSRYDQELTLASLDDDAEQKQQEIHKRLLHYRIHLFNFIFTSQSWSQHESEVMTKTLQSPFVDIIDKQIILGAMLMAQRTVFDVYKFLTLCQVVQNADNVYVRERALVGIALALPDSTDNAVYGQLIQPAFHNLLCAQGVSQEMINLQTQILLCMETKENERTINDDIIPTIMKNSQNMMGTKPSETDYLDSLLHPDVEEKQMEAVEASIDKMRNMQKNGADIFFSSFSQTKQFSFFFTMMNWFCPFYLEHPLLSAINSKKIPMAFLNKIIGGEMFCNSDKYSFLLSLAHVINQIPKDILEMMQKGEVAPMFEDKSTITNALVRRSYLNDLYRFFYLYSGKDNFRSPFASDSAACFFLNEIFKDEFLSSQIPFQVCRQLLKHRCYEALTQMINRYSNENEVEWLKLIAINHEKKGDYTLAMHYFYKAHQLTPDNNLIISRTANAAFMDAQYDVALKCYITYLDNASEDDDTDVEEYHMALCQLQLNQVDEAMKILFRLSYNDPENILYRMALAWGYMLRGKYAEAQNVYEAVDETGGSDADILRKSISQLMNHHNNDAISTLRRFIKRKSCNPKFNVLDQMFKQLSLLNLEPSVYDTCKTEVMILIDLALKDTL